MTNNQVVHLDISITNTETQEKTYSYLDIVGYGEEFGKPPMVCLTNVVGEDGDEVDYINIPADQVKLVAETMLDAIPQPDHYPYDPDSTPHHSATKLNFSYYRKDQMGRGFVGFQPSEDDHKKGQNDLNVLFLHQDSEAEDEETLLAVERDCAELTRLLKKFNVNNDFITERAKACGVKGSDHLTSVASETEPSGLWGSKIVEVKNFVDIFSEAHAQGEEAKNDGITSVQKDNLYKLVVLEYLDKKIPGIQFIRKPLPGDFQDTMEHEIRLAMAQQLKINDGLTRAAIARYRALRLLSVISGNEISPMTEIPDSIIETVRKQLLSVTR